MQLFKTWFRALTEPKKTFAEERKRASFDAGSRNILIGGAIYGLMLILQFFPLGFMDAANLILQSIARLFLSWIIAGTVFYLFAKLFDGRGAFTPQLYLMSLYMPLISIIAGALIAIPVAGQILYFLVVFYSLHLLTYVLVEVHAFSKMRAVLSWATPLMIFMALAAAFFYVFLEIFSAVLAPLI